MKIKQIFIVILATLIVIGSCFIYKFDKAQKELDVALDNASLKEEELQETKERIAKELEENIKLYNNKLEEIAKENDVVGMSVVVFKDEEIIDSYNYGYADVENKVKVNANTKYRIASISKVITTIGLMRLYDKGLFELDDKIDDVLGIDAYGDVTFKQLLTHTSGLYDSETYNIAAAGSHLSLEYVVRNSFSSYAPGENYEYTNFGMSSVGGIIEHLTGEYFMDYMRELFEDLGIDAAYVSDQITDFDSVAKLYEQGEVTNPKTWFKTSDYFKAYGLGNSYLLGAGDLFITANDLAKFAMALCNEGTYNGTQILSKEATELMLSDNFEYYDWSGNYKYTEGLSCHNFKTLVEGREIHGHTGAAYGVYTAMYFDPTDNTGVIILDNGADRIVNDEGYVSLLYDIANETYSIFFD